MSEDIFDELLGVLRECHEEITAVRASIKEAEASRHQIIEECAWLLEHEGHPFSAGLVRSLHDASPTKSLKDEIIEECAKVADAYAKEHWGHTEEEHAAEKIAELIRDLKGGVK